MCTISLFIIIYLANVSAEEAAQEKQAFYEMRVQKAFICNEKFKYLGLSSHSILI